jgi:hypothetical protein
MADITKSLQDTQKTVITARPRSAKTDLYPDGQPVALDGPLTVVKDSGDGSFVQDPAKPNEFEAIAGENEGDTVFTVTGKDASGNTKTSKVTLTVALALDDLELSAGPAVDK